MKKCLLFLMLITSTFTGFSTHLMGGEIVVLNDSQNSYYVLLTLYRDTLGIPISNTQDFFQKPLLIRVYCLFELSLTVRVFEV